MAHVVARQAGYSVLEINARSVALVAFSCHYSRVFSDSRSGQVIDDKVRPALESGFALGSKKPVLVVIDEIDGATGGGWTVVLKMGPGEEESKRVVAHLAAGAGEAWQDVSIVGQRLTEVGEAGDEVVVDLHAELGGKF